MKNETLKIKNEMIKGSNKMGNRNDSFGELLDFSGGFKKTSKYVVDKNKSLTLWSLFEVNYFRFID